MTRDHAMDTCVRYHTQVDNRLWATINVGDGAESLCDINRHWDMMMFSSLDVYYWERIR